MKVSVVTVTYNCGSIIRGTLESVIGQDFPNIEYIIVDGASTDDTLDVVYEYQNQVQFIISEPDEGVYDAMNKGIDIATGDWIIFMNAGDRFYGNSVISQICWDKYVDSGVVFGDYVNSSDPLTIVKCNRPFTQRKRQFITMGFHHQSSFVRSDLAKRIKFDLSFRLCADYNMIWKIWKEGYRIDRTNVVVALVENEEGLSANNRLLQIYEQGRACEQDNTLAFRIYYGYKVLRNKLKSILGMK